MTQTRAAAATAPRQTNGRPQFQMTIDGQTIAMPPGSSVLDAINHAAIYIPQLCKDPDQKARGACRTCLVEIEGVRGFPASCTTPCSDGMLVRVNAPGVERMRRGVIELTLGMHPDAGRTIRPNTSNDESNPFFGLDLVADKLVQYRGHFGTLASAKATNEDGYVIQKFARSVMETNNIDHCTRLCHSPSVHAMLRSLGSGATSNSYVDYENSGCLMVVGSDSSSGSATLVWGRAKSRPFRPGDCPDLRLRGGLAPRPQLRKPADFGQIPD